ncbi:hypothetical protein Bca52824_087699 [Brassica carinata]|uniref:Tf2-1-like SH3-like domain-containing protein n=1 Tax=Brassica carinata TaxID=52824 RepID=A0A8X7TNW9_BRACI|nr:hypothetical protein Bca52824_087699 [Brassica carinata]
MVEAFVELHETVRTNLETSTTKYKAAVDSHRRELQFKVGDKVWAVLTKERFPPGMYNKSKPRKIVPLEIVEKINANAYRLRLPLDMKTADVFNVKHLSPFHEPDDLPNSGSNFSSPGAT